MTEEQRRTVDAPARSLICGAIASTARVDLDLRGGLHPAATAADPTEGQQDDQGQREDGHDHTDDGSGGCDLRVV